MGVRAVRHAVALAHHCAGRGIAHVALRTGHLKCKRHQKTIGFLSFSMVFSCFRNRNSLQMHKTTMFEGDFEAQQAENDRFSRLDLEGAAGELHLCD